MGLFSKLFIKNCSICKTVTKDNLNYSEMSLKSFCREHLIQEFSKEFMHSSAKIILLHPNKNAIPIGTQFPYYPEKGASFFLDKNSKDKRAELFNFLERQVCIECNNAAAVLYFAPDSYQYNLTEPNINGLSPSIGALLCKQCALNKILPDLQSNPEPYENGLYIPFSSDGVYAKTIL